MFVVHQNLTIMKPVLFIDGARAVTLLRRLSEFVGAPVSSEFLSWTSERVVQETLARILDVLSRDGSHEESNCKG